MAVTALAWLNGQVGPLSEAKVPVEDRGFVLADGVYEVARRYGERFFDLPAHLDRFARSAATIELPWPVTATELTAIAEDLGRQAGPGDAELYIQLTRGVARRNHLFPADVPPTLLLWVQAPRAIAPALYVTGGAAVTLPDERWARCDIKAIGLLPNLMAKEKAKRRGALEAILVRDGLVTEGTSSNVAIVLGGTFVTPIADQRILPGVTRLHVLALARELGIPVAERDITPAELASADEVMLLGTMIEVMPVTRLDDLAVGTGQPGPVTRQLREAFGRRTQGVPATAPGREA